MMNPSKATGNESDKTVNKVLKTAHDNGYTEVEIFNLSPYYLTKSKKLAKFFSGIKKFELEKVHQKNLDLFKESIKMYPEDILIATGNQNIKIMQSLYTEFYSLLKNKEIYFYNKTKKGYYWHPLYTKSILQKDIIKPPV